MRPRDEDFFDIIRAQHEAGLKIGHMAAKNDIGKERVRRIMRRLGLYRAPKQRIKDTDVELRVKIADLVKQGIPRGQIRDMLRLGSDRFQRLCREMDPVSGHKIPRGRKYAHGCETTMPPRAKADAERLLKLVPKDTRDLTARLLGDPIPGRRAIDRRQENA